MDGTYICSQVKPSIFDAIIYSMILESSSELEIIELRQTLDEDVWDIAKDKCTADDIVRLRLVC